MSYRPICDTWILARPKVKHYGAYPNGFLERALPMIGCSGRDKVLHLCGGRAKDYPNKRLVVGAVTVDSDPRTKPDVVADLTKSTIPKLEGIGFAGVLADPPYTDDDHAEYHRRGAPVHELPSASHMLRLALLHVEPGRRVGVLHYIWPRPPAIARSIALISVVCGFGNRLRCFSVFERVDAPGS